MAESNPLMDAYPELSPSCSKRVYCIAGIQTTVYGIEELQPAEHVACLWLLHPRLQDQSCMAPLAFSTIDTWNSYVSSSRGPPRMPGLIAVSFDQRNHGTREVDPRANRDWRTGNYTHASDMFANYEGTVEDTSQLITYLSSYVFPTSERYIFTHLVCGISLGGHAAWQCLFREPRITAGVSIIGCPDYVRLMSDRARLSKLPSSNNGTFLGSSDFPPGLIEATNAYDPTGMTLQGIPFPDRDAILAGEPAPNGNLMLESRLARRIQGKRILNLSGTDDKLVPYRCSKPFIQLLSRYAASSNSSMELSFHFVDKVFEGVGHAMSMNMAQEVNHFVVETLSQAGTAVKSSSAKM